MNDTAAGPHSPESTNSCAARTTRNNGFVAASARPEATAQEAGPSLGSGERRVLIGGIGYRNLRDGSAGAWVADQLAPRAGAGIDVEDISYHPVGLTQNLQDRPDYARIVIASAVARGREPGTITAYRWDRQLPETAEIQARVSEAVTGVISLDNTLIVCEALRALPEDVRVVEIEPADESWGEEFSPMVASRLDDLLETVWSFTEL